MNSEEKTILYVLKKSQDYLLRKNIPNPRLDAEVILSELLGMERIRLYSNFERILNETEQEDYRSRIKERGNLKPVSYITGKKNFFNSSFYVTPDVLIPRPETEELVEWVLSEINGKEKLKILDLGTGSGCIGISLKKENPSLSVTLSDIDEYALNIAKENSRRILNDEGNVLNFANSNLFQHFVPEDIFDIIVSNPPYIPISEKDSIMSDVLDHEPHLALFLENPEAFYSELLSDSKKHLHKNGTLFLETHPDWIYRIIEIAVNAGFQKSEIKRDLSGKDRFLKLTSNEENL
ncbi:MAG: peptide chain release factor N(5)-glutamine methyltransferase [Leptospira sp.]|nr:peptide chain release factor N(5)-glutamine methyltransferase [Leptospira sp.]